MRISIALASCNGAKYILAQLESFLAQTRLPDELVITDDGSSDNTIEIINRFAENAPFPVICTQNTENLGYSGNFNQALLKTTGDLVFISDQDDVWYPNKIERMAALAAEHPESLVLMNDAGLTDEELNPTGLTKLGQIRSAGYPESCFMMGCCATVRRELLNLCLPIPEGYGGHDNWIVGIAEGMGRKQVLPVVLQDYRRHDNNESQWIVNRTTRVTPWHVKWELWRMRFRRLAEHHSGLTGQRKTPGPDVSLVLLRQWLEATIPRTPDVYVEDLRRYQAEIDAQSHLQELRQSIRSQRYPRRFASAVHFWWDGGYARFLGIKSLLRDLLGD
jgi:glycosyltransferase involved in cell wall biosynthesis